jgi:ABC-type transport system involved in multi-copper enzyme maturation permease subunit
MTTAPAAPDTRAAVPPARKAGFGHLLISEWTKLRSVRSTVWTLILFVIIVIGLTVLITSLANSSWGTGPRSGSRDATIIADPVGVILGVGVGLGQLTIAVLGVMVITTEYSTGVIRASLLAVPRRVPMLAAKAVVFAILVVVLAEIVCFGSFFIGAAILHSHISVSLSDPGVARAVLGAGLYLTVLGLFALAIGGLLRHTAAGISTVIGIILVIPIIANFLPSNSVDNHISAYLPAAAGSLISHVHQVSGDLLSPWQGFGLLCLYTAILLAAAAILLKRRDA